MNGRRNGPSPCSSSTYQDTRVEGEIISATISNSELDLRQQVAAVTYAFAGGYADATGYLLTRTFTGHVTGNLVLLAISLRHPQWEEIIHRLIAILIFLLATGAGFRIARFGSLLSPWTLFLTQAVFVGTVSMPFVRESHNYGTWLVVALCSALGLQNGAVTSAGGISLHATFLSGDLTTLVGYFSKRLSLDAKDPQQQRRPSAMSKGNLLMAVPLSFVVGAYCASLLIGRVGTHVPVFLLPPLCAAAALSSAQDASAQAP